MILTDQVLSLAAGWVRLHGYRIVPHFGNRHSSGHRLDEAEHGRQRARRY
ncbi:hypothetical protein OOZ51_03430 [Arthrobacter sp. MI7-26]|nr:hypothetical protein [Arthrobacter sp. MI7-26]